MPHPAPAVTSKDSSSQSTASSRERSTETTPPVFGLLLPTVLDALPAGQSDVRVSFAQRTIASTSSVLPGSTTAAGMSRVRLALRGDQEDEARSHVSSSVRTF